MKICSSVSVYSGIGGTEVISDPVKLYQAVKSTLLGPSKVPKQMKIGNMNMFKLCNSNNSDFVLLFLCNPDVLKYTSDTLRYVL